MQAFNMTNIPVFPVSLYLRGKQLVELFVEQPDALNKRAKLRESWTDLLRFDSMGELGRKGYMGNRYVIQDKIESKGASSQIFPD